MNDTERELGAALRRTEQHIDPHLYTRIAAARAYALAQPHEPWLRRWLAPVAGVAVLAGVLGIGVLLPLQRAEPERAVAEDAVEDPEFYQDLDFYLWLAESDMGSHG